MTSEELINHLLYEYGTKTVSRNNYNEEKLKATQEIKEDLEAVKIIKKNARLSCKFAKECDKDGHLSGIFAILEAVLEGDDLEFIERWIKNNGNY